MSLTEVIALGLARQPATADKVVPHRVALEREPRFFRSRFRVASYSKDGKLLATHAGTRKQCLRAMRLIRRDGFCRRCGGSAITVTGCLCARITASPAMAAAAMMPMAGVMLGLVKHGTEWLDRLRQEAPPA